MQKGPVATRVASRAVKPCHLYKYIATQDGEQEGGSDTDSETSTEEEEATPAVPATVEVPKRGGAKAHAAAPAVEEEQGAPAADPAVAEEQEALAADPAVEEEQEAPAADPAVAEEQEALAADPAVKEEQEAAPVEEQEAAPVGEQEAAPVEEQEAAPVEEQELIESEKIDAKTYKLPKKDGTPGNLNNYELMQAEWVKTGGDPEGFDRESFHSKKPFSSAEHFADELKKKKDHRHNTHKMTGSNQSAPFIFY